MTTTVGIKAFGEVLRGTKVTEVGLRGNKIGDKGAQAFGEALKGTNVTKVYLDHNQIGDAGAKAFGEALKGTHVTKVSLDFNQIGDAGIKAFGEALKGTNVSKVSLKFNQIGDAGATAFAACIPHTVIINADLYVKSKELSDALELNKRKLFLTPYYMTVLRMLPKEKMNRHTHLPIGALDTEDGRLRYAGGILMKVPSDICDHILSFLPLMNSSRWRFYTEDYLKIAKERHPDGLKIEEKISMCAP